jgi:hypothetical protein
MILSDSARQKVIDDKHIRLKLAVALNFTSGWILTRAYQNKPNGPLTTYAAIEVLQQELGMSKEEILQEASVNS